MKKFLIGLILMTILIAMLGLTVWAESPAVVENRVLSLKEGEHYSFYRQDRDNAALNETKDHRIIAIIDLEWLTKISFANVEIAFGNGEDTKVIQGIPNIVYKEVYADTDEGRSVYTAAEGCVLFGWVVKGAPLAYSNITAIINTEETYSEGLQYTQLSDGTYEVSSIGNCQDTEIIIPSLYEGKPVTSIGDSAFSECYNLTSIKIPDSVKSIGSGAFWWCDSLTSITIPDSVTSIGSGAFMECFNLKSITIPDSMTSIGDSAFSGCSSLTSITILDSVTSIGYGAFYGCSSLTSVTIPNSVTSIGGSAFEGCSSLSSIVVDANNSVYYSKGNCLIEKETNTLLFGCNNSVIPDSVTSIADHAFYDCSSLMSITIPDSVTSIGGSAFYSCYKLIEVINYSSLPLAAGSNDYGYVAYYAKTVHSGDTQITEQDEYLFCETESDVYLIGYIGQDTELVLPQTFNGKKYQIHSYAFENCISLTTVTIPDSVTGIGNEAFSGCSSLTEVTIGNSVTSIGQSAFEDCSSLTSIVIPDSVTSIGVYAFRDCTSLTSVTIGNSVTSIGSSAFQGCRSLMSIEIPDSVTSIGNGAFLGCSSLTGVTIPDGVTGIDQRTFYDCSSLMSITIGSHVTGIGFMAFNGCNKLIEVINHSSLPLVEGSNGYGYVARYAKTVHSGDTKIAEQDGYLFCETENDVYLLGYIGQDTELVLPQTFNGKNYQIFQYAFSNCSSLTTITIPDGVMSIGNRAFSGCGSLACIEIPESVMNIGDYAFEDCSNIVYTVYENGKYLGNSTNPYVVLIDTVSTDFVSFSIHSNTKMIYQRAFSECYNLTSIKIPDGVTTICRGAFYECHSLMSIVIPDSVTSIGDYAFGGYPDCIIYCEAESRPEGWHEQWVEMVEQIIWGATNELEYTLSDDSSGYIVSGIGTCYDIDIVIPSMHKDKPVIGIGDSAFSWNRNVTSVTIPDSVTSIGWEAFSGCSSLTSIVIPNSVTSIGSSAFQGCWSLTSITIPDSVMSIGSEAFADCSSLTSIVIPDSVTSIGDHAFYNCSSLTSITIPNSVTSIGDYAFNGCLRLIEIINHSSLPLVVGSDSYGYVAYYAKTVHNGATKIIEQDGYLLCETENDVYLIGYVGQDTELVLPQKFNGKNYQIYYSAFSDCTSLTSVTISDSVTSIGSSAFYNCWSLTSVTISDSVTSIGSEAFYYCWNLTSVTIGSGVTSIGNDAFYNCSSLTSITIPDSVTSIGNNAFSSCSSLTSVTIGNGVTSIGESAFRNCTSLESITIPNSVTSIGNNAFSSCSSLTSVTIGNGVTSIGESAFAWCESLTSITIPDSVTNIGEWAFGGCWSLTAIYCEAQSQPDGWNEWWNPDNCPVVWSYTE